MTDVLKQFDCQFLQDIIASMMTIVIIYAFEIINIQHGNCQRSAITIREHDLSLQVGENTFAVREEGQRVSMRYLIGLGDDRFEFRLLDNQSAFDLLQFSSDRLQV